MIDTISFTIWIIRPVLPPRTQKVYVRSDTVQPYQLCHREERTGWCAPSSLLPACWPLLRPPRLSCRPLRSRVSDLKLPHGDQVQVKLGYRLHIVSLDRVQLSWLRTLDIYVTASEYCSICRTYFMSKQAYGSSSPEAIYVRLYLPFTFDREGGSYPREPVGQLRRWQQEG